MTHRRIFIRAVLRLALGVAPRLSAMTEVSLWQAKIDADTLPVYGITTPTEAKDSDAQNSAERAITVLVAIKRRGLDELEDTLDEDSDHVEALVIGALRTEGIDARLDRTDVSIDGSADRRVGTLSMTFQAFVQTTEPLTT